MHPAKIKVVNFRRNVEKSYHIRLACDAAESNKLILVIPFGSAPESMTHDFAASSEKEIIETAKLLFVISGFNIHSLPLSNPIKVPPKVTYGV